MEKNVTLINKSFSNDSLLINTTNTTNTSNSTGNLLKNKMVAVKIHDASTTSLFQTPNSVIGLGGTIITAPHLHTSMSTSSLTNATTTTNTNTNSNSNNINHSFNRLLDNNNNNTSSRRIFKNSKNDSSSTSFETSLIQMHRFFKEQKIYTDPNDNYKRRTVVLIRSHAQTGNNNHSNNRNKSGGRYVN